MSWSLIEKPPVHPKFNFQENYDRIGHFLGHFSKTKISCKKYGNSSSNGPTELHEKPTSPTTDNSLIVVQDHEFSNLGGVLGSYLHSSGKV